MPWADLLSVSRLPLGLVFLVYATSAWFGVVIVVLAAVTDVLDGWVARRAAANHAGVRSHRGDWLDPLCDKLFIGSVLLGLVWHFGAPPRLVALLLLREWLQLASMGVYALLPSLRKNGGYDYRANYLGKATTMLQFVTVLVILFGMRAPWALAIVTAVLGACSLATYIARVAPKPPLSRG